MPADVFTDRRRHRDPRHASTSPRPCCRASARQGHGTLVIVNSLLGSVTVPNMGAYATAKWGQRAIARTLQQEVRDERDVHVCIVSPGSTNTPIYYQAANYLTDEARAAGAGAAARTRSPRRSPSSLDRPRKHVSVPVGPPNPVIITGFRLLPFVYDRIVGPLFKLGALTRKRAGPDRRATCSRRRPTRNGCTGTGPSADLVGASAASRVRGAARRARALPSTADAAAIAALIAAGRRNRDDAAMTGSMLSACDRSTDAAQPEHRGARVAHGQRRPGPPAGRPAPARCADRAPTARRPAAAVLTCVAPTTVATPTTADAAPNAWLAARSVAGSCESMPPPCRGARRRA